MSCNLGHVYSTAVFCKHGERRRHLGSFHPSSTGGSKGSPCIIQRCSHHRAPFLYLLFQTASIEVDRLMFVEEGSNARVRVFGTQAHQVRAVCGNLRAHVPEGFGRRHPVLPPPKQSALFAPRSFPFPSLVDAHWSAISARIEEQSRDLISPSETRPSATFPAWADVVMEEVVRREWQHARHWQRPRDTSETQP